MHGPSCIFWANLTPLSRLAADGDGLITLTPGELRLGIQSLSLRLTAAQVIVHPEDPPSDIHRRISNLHLLGQHTSNTFLAQVEDVVTFFDDDGTGSIELREVRHLAKCLNNDTCPRPTTRRRRHTRAAATRKPALPFLLY